MGKIESLTLEFTNGGCSSGSQLKGCIILVVKKPMTIDSVVLEVFGDGKVKWEYAQSETFYKSKQVFLNEMIMWDDRSKSRNVGVMEPKRYTYDFSITLPANLPSTFKTKYGYISYAGEATVRRKRCDIAQANKEFWVSRPVDLNDFPDMELRLAREGTQTSRVHKSFEKRGDVKATFKIDKCGYVPGQNIVIDAAIQNSSTVTLKWSSVELNMITTIEGRDARGKVKTKARDEVAASRQGGSIEGNTTGKWEAVSLYIPRNLTATGMYGCDFINVDYVLTFSVVDLVTISTKVFIGTEPFREPPKQPAVVVPEKVDLSSSRTDTASAAGASVAGAAGGTLSGHEPHTDTPPSTRGPAINASPESPPSYEECMRNLGISSDDKT